MRYTDILNLIKNQYSRHKKKLLLLFLIFGIVWYHYNYPKWNGKSWYWYYSNGKSIYEQKNKISISMMIKSLKCEFFELLDSKNIYEFWDELWDVIHVFLLLIQVIFRLPYQVPALARVASIKCAERFRFNGCIRSMTNCYFRDHICL